jgi:hypothetical protein
MRCGAIRKSSRVPTLPGCRQAELGGAVLAAQACTRRLPKRGGGAVRLDHHEVVSDADRRIRICVRDTDDESVKRTSMPFDLERQPCPAVRSRALALKGERQIGFRRPAVPFAVLCALPFAQRR